MSSTGNILNGHRQPDPGATVSNLGPTSRRIPTLDGWRAIAILMVTGFHLSLNIWTNRSALILITQYGAIGVDVFFGLSGLLITKLLLDEHDRTGRISLKAFYVRRWFRVVLPCYLFLAVLFVFSLVQNSHELISGVLFFRNYLPEDFPGPYTVHLWSLAVEEHFYLLWPPLLVLVTVKHGQLVAMWLSIACGLWRITFAELQLTLASTANAAFRTDFRIDALFWGCVIAFVLHRSYAHMKQWLTPVVWTGLLIAYLCCLIFYSLLTRLWMPMLLPLLIAGTVTHPDWRLSRILDSAAARWIGKISYSLYLWQVLFLPEGSGTLFWWQRYPVNLAFVVLTAAVSFYFVESTLQRWGHRLSARVSKDTSTFPSLPERATNP